MNIDKIEVSIIVPIYNGEKYIERCINSLLMQETSCQYEILLIDDGSIDDSLSIINRYSKNIPNIMCFSQPNKGPGAARNVGLANAQGKFVVFVDADDFVTPYYIENLYQNAFVSQGVGIVVSGILGNGKKLMEFKGEFFDKEQFGKMLPEMKILENGYAVGKLYQTELIHKYDIRFYENVRYAEDLFFYLQYLLYADWIIFVDKYDYHYSVNNPHSLILSYNPFESELQGFTIVYNLLNTFLRKYPQSEAHIYKCFGWVGHFAARAIISIYRGNKMLLRKRDRIHLISSNFNKINVSLLYYNSSYNEKKERIILWLLYKRKYRALDCFVKYYYKIRYSFLLSPLFSYFK